MRLLLGDGGPTAGVAPPPPPALASSSNNGAFVASKAVLYISIVAVVLAWCIASCCFLRHCARQRRRRLQEQGGGDGAAAGGAAGDPPACPAPHALPVLIVNPDNITFELGIKEQDPYALVGSEGWPGPPGGRGHPLKALRVPTSPAAATEADAGGGSPLSVLARQRGYQGFGGGAAGGWSAQPHLPHVQLAQAGVWLPADDEPEAAGAGSHDHASRDGAGSSSTSSASSSSVDGSDGSSGSMGGGIIGASSHDDPGAGPLQAADSRS